MGFSFGALAVVARSSSLGGLGGDPIAASAPGAAIHVPELSTVRRVLGLVELRSLFLGAIFVAVSFILAYLTNPSEASFRTYLTELAFRRHLSRLYDGDLDSEASQNGNGLHNVTDSRRQPSQTKHPASLSSSSSTTITTSALHLPIIAPSQSNIKSGLPKFSNGAAGDAANPTQALSASDGFHFANRATIGLRTPGHVFRSLGLCTIAAIPIVDDDETAALGSSSAVSTSKAESASINGDGDLTLAGKWFIGAFGKWWVGGTLQLRQQAINPGARGDSNKNLEKGDRFSAGVLNFRALDLDPITEGLVKNVADSISSFTGKARKAVTGSGNGNSANGNANGSPNGKAGRGRRGTGPSIHPTQRNSSPPPLPKSASLPLHAPRLPGNPSDHANGRTTSNSKLPAALNGPAPAVVASNVVMPLASPTKRASQSSLRNRSSSTSSKHAPTVPGHGHSNSSTLAVPSSVSMSLSPSNASHVSVASATSALDTSPIIIDILKQLHATQDDVAESRSQLGAFIASSESSHAQLQASLDTARESKRREDAERVEAKARLKSLEDQKRHAEATKRDAEKRLKQALTTRDRAASKVQQLSKDIDSEQKKAHNNTGRMSESATWRDEQTAQLKANMDAVKREIKVAEDVITALVLRAKELELQIQEEKGALARVEAEIIDKRRRQAARNANLAATSPTASFALPNQGMRSPPLADSDLNHALVVQTVLPQDPLNEVPSSPATHSSGAPSPSVPLYQRRHIAHEPDALNISPILHDPPTATRHTLSLGGIDEALFAPGHMHSNSSSSGKNLSPIGSLPSMSLGTASSVSSVPTPEDVRLGSGKPFTLPHTRQSHFSPFADSGPISPFTTSLISSSLLSSIDDAGPVVQSSPTGLDDFALTYPTRRSSVGSGTALGPPFVWQRPSSIESPTARQAWEDRAENGVHLPSPGSDVLYSSPGHSHPRSPHDDFMRFQNHRAALSSESLYREELETSNNHSGTQHWRWFGRNTSPAQLGHSGSDAAALPASSPPKTRKESSLNPDAKVFRFTRGRSFAFPSRNGPATDDKANNLSNDHSVIGEGRPRASGSTPSLNTTLTPPLASMPPAPVGSSAAFYSSLLAFTPSAQERAALNRAMGGHSGSIGGINPAWNASAERLPSDHSPSPNLTHAYAASQYPYPQGSSARSSQIDLAKTAPVWGELYLTKSRGSGHATFDPLGDASSNGNGNGNGNGSLTHNQPTNPSTPAQQQQPRRTFSSLWNRGKKAAVPSPNGGVADEES